MMSSALAIILPVLCGLLCGAAATTATCSSEDSTLKRGTPSGGEGITSQLCTYHVIGGLSYYQLLQFEFLNEHERALANITVHCFDESNNMVFNESDNTINSNQNHIFYLNDDLPRIHNKAIRCNYTGCYHQENSDIYYLLNITDECYLDFNECSSDDYNDCAKNATCTNDEMGTYNCVCHEGFVGNGSYCEEEVFPHLESISESLIIRDGNSATLHCTSSSETGSMLITWSTSIPGVILPQPTVVQNGIKTTSSITLESVDESYSGDYFCNVSNRFGDKVGNTSILVITISKPEIVVATTGSTVDLFCNASGSPGLRYAWIEESVNGSALTITNVGRADEMDYVCIIFLNEIPIGECRTSLLTQGPEITRSPANITATVTATFSLNCTAVNNDDATNNLTIHWMKNKHLLKNISSKTVLHDESKTVTSQLFLTYSVATQTSDIYQCIATNRKLEDGTRSLQAFVSVCSTRSFASLTTGLVISGVLILAIVASAILMAMLICCIKRKRTGSRMMAMKVVHHEDCFTNACEKPSATASSPTVIDPAAGQSSENMPSEFHFKKKLFSNI